jgi:hypothetical protein
VFNKLVHSLGEGPAKPVRGCIPVAGLLDRDAGSQSESVSRLFRAVLPRGESASDLRPNGLEPLTF